MKNFFSKKIVGDVTIWEALAVLAIGAIGFYLFAHLPEGNIINLLFKEVRKH